MRATLAGAGAWEALSGPGEGRVLASFRNACYLAFPRGLAALVAPRVHPGPIHVRLDEPPPAMAVGTPVRMSDGWLLLSDCAAPVAGASVWRGRLPRPERFREVAGVIPDVVAEAAGRSLVSSEGELGDRCRERLRAGDLEGLAVLLAGRGPGLTPAGDDALMGVLLVLRTAWGPQAERRLLPVAAAAPTGVLGRSLLAWA
ncbi:MAG: DUF2877 domain-containing protein, partial [Actinomycetota bacterium]